MHGALRITDERDETRVRGVLLAEELSGVRRRQHFVGFHVVWSGVAFRISLLAAFHWTASVLPLVKSSKERLGVANPEFSQRERRTGARLLGLSTAVRDHRFGECSQLFDTAIN